MRSLAQEAAREFFLLNLGVRTTAEVVKWADTIIAGEEVPRDALIEISTTPLDRLDRFISILSDLRTGSDFWAAVREAMPIVHGYVASHPSEAERIANALFLIGASFGAKIPDAFSFIYRFDDAFSLAREGMYGTVDGVYGEFLAALGQFQQEQNQPATGQRP